VVEESYVLDMVERTFGDFEDLIASRPGDDIVYDEGASRLKRIWAKTLNHILTQQ
jgi:hypothetical protein